MKRIILAETDSFYRLFLVAWLVGSCISFAIQFFYPSMVASSSIWTFSEGWQREIALWNVGLIIGIAYALKLKNRDIIKFVAKILVCISLILGSNHLISMILLVRFELINFFGVVLNYLAGGLGIYIIYIDTIGRK